MNIRTQYSVNQAPGIPVIPAVEPKSEYGGPFLDSCLRRNDELNNCSPVTLYSKPTIVIPAVELDSEYGDPPQDSCLRGNDELQNDVFQEVLF